MKKVMEITPNTTKPLREYHKFGFKPSKYKWSRTYEQFKKDLETAYGIRMDDGHRSQIIACRMAKKPVYLGITTSFIGKTGYMNWKEVEELSKYHIICNHSHSHEHFDDKTEEEIIKDLTEAQKILNAKYYLPTYNFVNNKVINACQRLGLEILNNVILIDHEI
jgi:REP element-mobilizing transposase RayT